MSKWEQPMLERYWRTVSGGLFLEFPLASKSPTNSARYLDGLIVPDFAEQMWQWSEAKNQGLTPDLVEGKNIIVVQAKYKPKRLCMPLLGQTLFAAELLKKLRPASVRGVALCRQDDSALREAFENFPNMEVVVDDA
jgi:hypothetical protein